MLIRSTVSRERNTPIFLLFLPNPALTHPLSELEGEIYREIDLLKEKPVKEKELQKVKNRLKVDSIRSLSSNQGLASMLSYYQVVVGDWRYMEKQLDIIEKITPEEIMAAAKKYLVEDNRTVAHLTKK